MSSIIIINIMPKNYHNLYDFPEVCNLITFSTQPMPCEPLHDLAQHFNNLCLEIPDMYEKGGSEVKQIIDDWKAKTKVGKFAERRKGNIEV